MGHLRATITVNPFSHVMPNTSDEMTSALVNFLERSSTSAKDCQDSKWNGSMDSLWGYFYDRISGSLLGLKYALVQLDTIY